MAGSGQVFAELFPDMDLMEEDQFFSKDTQAVLLQFHVEQITPRQNKNNEELLAEKAIPFPFVPTLVQTYYNSKENKVQYSTRMLNVDLYWDAQEQLLIGIDSNELLVWDQVNGKSYCMRYGDAPCFYSPVHHLAYQLPPWPGKLNYANIKEMLKAARAFRFEINERQSF